MALDAVRTEMKRLMKATVDDASHWTYNDGRPCVVEVTWKKGQHVKSDCSKGVQKICRWAKAPDPMGNGWTDWGNSQTICAHLSHFSDPSQLRVGDPVTFGYNGDEHAAMVYEAGKDPLLWSDGHQGAPNFYRLSEDRRVHQLLMLPIKVQPITPQDKLRARTGYWDWVAWNEGEGDWKHYGRRNPGVRPHVPEKISAAWLKSLKTFEANRTKGNPPTHHK